MKQWINTSLDKAVLTVVSLVFVTLTLSGCSKSIEAQVNEGCGLLKEGWAEVVYDGIRTEKYEEARKIFQKLSEEQPRWIFYAAEIGKLSDWKSPNWETFKGICEVQE
jgi:hypothetical protein